MENDYNLRCINIAVVCKTFEEAEKFIQYLAPEGIKRCDNPYTVETNCLRIMWIPANNETFCGYRFQQIYVSKDIYNSEWFKTVIYPMQFPGIALIE